MADTTSTTETSTAAPLPRFPQDPAPGPEPAVPGRQRRRILWLGVVVALLAVAGMAAWLVHVVTTARALQAVTSSVTLPAAVPPAAPVAPAPAPPAQATAAAADLPVTAAPIAAIATAAPPETPQPAADARAGKPEKAKGAVKAKARKGREAAKRQARKAVRAGGTFARCPALGKPGAVMCRWHICNGAAGKEAVCRPYLERRP